MVLLLCTDYLYMNFCLWTLTLINASYKLIHWLLFSLTSINIIELLIYLYYKFNDDIYSLLWIYLNSWLKFLDLLIWYSNINSWLLSYFFLFHVELLPSGVRLRTLADTVSVSCLYLCVDDLYIFMTVFSWYQVVILSKLRCRCI